LFFPQSFRVIVRFFSVKSGIDQGDKI